MSEKKIFNDVEYEKIDTATFTINGQIYNNSFTKESLSNLAKDGMVTIDIDASSQNNPESFISEKLEEVDLEKNISDTNLRENLPTNLNLAYKKTTFIVLGMLCIIILCSFIIF